MGKAGELIGWLTIYGQSWKQWQVEKVYQSPPWVYCIDRVYEYMKIELWQQSYARFFSFIYRLNLDGQGEAKQACIYTSFSFKTFKDTKECHNRLRINIRMAFFKYFIFWKNYWICCSCHFGSIRWLSAISTVDEMQFKREHNKVFMATPMIVKFKESPSVKDWNLGRISALNHKFFFFWGWQCNKAN